MQKKWLSADFHQSFGSDSKPFAAASGQNDNSDFLVILGRM